MTDLFGHQSNSAGFADKSGMTAGWGSCLDLQRHIQNQDSSLIAIISLLVTKMSQNFEKEPSYINFRPRINIENCSTWKIFSSKKV